jgi:hypothetical protein
LPLLFFVDEHQLKRYNGGIAELIGANTVNLPDNEIYQIYIGGIDPRDFVGNCETTEQAVSDFIDNWPWGGEPIPSGLADTLVRYIDRQIEYYRGL